jgi:eukaryotic-like serine/threonine-protein kinase
MAVKIALESFLAVLKRSNLVPPDRLQPLLEAYQRQSATTNDSRKFADFLIAQKALTSWQAEKLLQGKHKGFFLGKYRLLSLVGKGGMSSVYLAEHQLMRRRCAIKVLPTRRLNNASYLARFHREAQAVAALDHRNIVRAYDVDHEVDGEMDIHFLVMEYVEGTGLLDLVVNCPNSRLPPVVAAEYIRQAALGLQHAHVAGLVHRDIKPGNLLVDTTGTVKVLDLGLARFFEGSEETSLTVQHDERVLGTADYLAPEQAVDSHGVDARADIYSLGCTLYLCLTGRPPFTQGTLAQRLMAHQTKEPPTVESLEPGVPRELADIVRKMMAKDPANRFQSAAEVAAALEAWLKTTPKSDFDRTFAGLDRLTPNPAPKSTVAGGADTVRPGSRDDASRTPLVERRRKEPPPRTQKVSPHSASDRKRRESAPRNDDRATRKASAIRIDDQETTIGGPPEHPLPVFIPDIPGSETQLGSDTEKELTADSSSSLDLPVDTEDSFVRRSAKKKQTSPLVTMWDGLNKRQRHTVIIWGSVGLGTLVLLLLMVWTMLKSDDEQPSSAAKSPAAAAPPVAKREYGPEILIGSPDGLPTIGAALDYVRLNKDKFPGEPTKPSWTIKVPGGKVYDESIRVHRSEEGSLAEWVSIVSEGETPAVLNPSGAGPVIDLEGAEKLTIRGFVLDGKGRETVARLSGFLVGMRLEDLQLRDVGHVGIACEDISGLQSFVVQFTRLRFQGASPDAVAVQIRDIRQASFEGCRFIGLMRTGIEFSEGAYDQDISIRHCVFHDLQSAVRFVGQGRDVQRIVFANNTIHRVQQGLVFDEMPLPGSAGLMIHHNLFIQVTGAEAEVLKAYDAGRAAELLVGALNNRTDRSQAVLTDGSAELDVFAQGQRGVQAPEFASTDPGDPGFLKPTSPSGSIEVNSPAQGADPIVGAIAP